MKKRTNNSKKQKHELLGNHENLYFSHLEKVRPFLDEKNTSQCVLGLKKYALRVIYEDNFCKAYDWFLNIFYERFRACLTRSTTCRGVRLALTI